jgi:GAF domain-containing protein
VASPPGSGAAAPPVSRRCLPLNASTRTGGRACAKRSGAGLAGERAQGARKWSRFEATRPEESFVGCLRPRDPGGNVVDHALFMESLSGFARALAAPHHAGIVLRDLVAHVTAALGLVGSAVSLTKDGALHVSSAANRIAADLEQAQHDHGRGPCIEAVRTGEVVTIPDLEQHRGHWPEYVATARRHHVRSVVGIPLVVLDETVGALDLYAGDVRAWSGEDLVAARVFVDLASGHLAHASELDRRGELNTQLQQALDQRWVIEQAKGITAHAHHTTIAAAFELIRRHARHHSATVHSVAEAIVNAGLRV